MKYLFSRLFFGVLFALPLMILTFALLSTQKVQAQSASPTPTVDQSGAPQSTGVTKLSCPACHESFQTAWETSPHGRSTTDPAFTTAWNAQGKPNQCLTCHTTGYNPDTNTYKAAGITCQACHDTDAANHPMKPMAADRSSQMCGKCHTETYFEWQASAHRKAGVDCIACHDPHSNTLKASDAADQCASCHRDRAANFAASAHSKKGLTCADCHLAKLTDPTQDGHARRDHSFTVALTTCNACHSYQMHDPTMVHPENPTPQAPDSEAAVVSVDVASQPQPVQPLGFATLSGVFGLAAGAILAPWLERLSHRRKNKKQDQEQDQDQNHDQDQDKK